MFINTFSARRRGWFFKAAKQTVFTPLIFFQQTFRKNSIILEIIFRFASKMMVIVTGKTGLY